MVKIKYIIFCFLIILNNNIALAETQGSHSTLHNIAFYLPNRVLDIFDVFRLRVRIGPGISVGARATKVAQAFIGSHATIYAGLPGPRLRKLPKSPIGVETHSGVTLSLADATIDGALGPDYSSTEIGAGLQVAIIGIDIGFDPVELIDFASGILTIDLRDDDF